MNCSNCGAPLTPGQIRCPKCGLEFSQPVPNYLPPAPSPPERKQASVTPWVILGCGGSGLFIILILAAILFPVFAKAREKARQITCADNMKQIGLALAQYSQDNDSKLPLAATWEKASSTYEMHKFSCPDVAVGSGYAYNSTLGNEKITKFSDGSTTVSVFETTKTEPNANDKLTSIVTPGRHSGSNNYLFLDGHIDSSTSPPSP